MKECPDTDVIVTIADALDWNVDDGLRHLQSCSDCRAQLETLQLTRTALLETGVVEHHAVARITSALAAAAHAERDRARRTSRVVSVAEGVLAAVAAPVVLISSGIEISLPAGALTALLGAAFLMFGRSRYRHAV